MMGIVIEKRRSMLAVFLLLAIVTAVGCTTMGSIHNYRGKGERITLKADYFEVFEAAKQAATMQGLRIKEENIDGRYLIVGHGVSLMSWGELVGIYFDTSANGKETSVEVVSKARVQTNLFAPKWEGKLLETIKRTVKERD